LNEKFYLIKVLKTGVLVGKKYDLKKEKYEGKIELQA
jgi:hypothetical protein